MAEWPEIVKLALRPRYSFCLCVTSGIILLAPLPEFLFLDTVQGSYAPFIGIVFIFTLLVWIVEIFIVGGKKIRSRSADKHKKEEVLSHLDSLSRDECFLLARALELKQQTVRWRVDADEVSSLIAKGLLDKVPHDSTYGSKPYTIPRFVWSHLLNHKEEIAGRFQDFPELLKD